MIARYHHKNITWIDLESPSLEEVRSIMDEFEIHPLTADELLLPTQRPKVDMHKDFIYIILHFPAFKHTHASSSNQEVDFIIGKNVLITTRYDTIDPLHKFSKIFETNSVLDKKDIGSHAGYLFYFMAKKLYRSVVHELEYISDHMREIENKIFEGKEKEMVVEISKMSRQLLDFRHATGFHREVLDSFEVASRSFFGDPFVYYSRSLIGEYHRLQTEIDSLTATVIEIRETNNSLITTKQNEIMKVLTIMAFVTFPLSLVAAVFGMNTTNLPVVGTPYDFWVIIGIMLAITTTFFVFFKYKKWL